MSKILFILAGGAVGAILRYASSLLAYQWLGDKFPWGTLLVNVIGSFAAGFVWAFLDETTGQARTNAFFFIGLLGAYTTFSTYALEALRLFQDGQTATAITHLIANNIGALVAVIAGFWLSRLLFAPGK